MDLWKHLKAKKLKIDISQVKNKDKIYKIIRKLKGVVCMNNKMIGECKHCSQYYCMECSEHEHWEEFCSESCDNQYQTEENLTDGR